MFGIGAEFSFNDYVAVRLDATRYFLPSRQSDFFASDDLLLLRDGTAKVSSEIDAISASLVVRF